MGFFSASPPPLRSGEPTPTHGIVQSRYVAIFMPGSTKKGSCLSVAGVTVQPVPDKQFVFTRTGPASLVVPPALYLLIQMRFGNDRGDSPGNESSEKPPREPEAMLRAALK